MTKIDEKEWDKVKGSLLNGLPPDKVDVVETMLENTRREMMTAKKKRSWRQLLRPVTILKERMKYLVGVKQLNPFAKVVLPIIRRVMPQTIAQEIVGVQPMSAPVGQVFTLKTRYDPTEGMNIHERWRYEIIQVIMPIVKRVKLLWALRHSRRFMFRQYREMMK